jgi:hypothetical protein
MNRIVRIWEVVPEVGPRLLAAYTSRAKGTCRAADYAVRRALKEGRVRPGQVFEVDVSRGNNCPLDTHLAWLIRARVGPASGREVVEAGREVAGLRAGVLPQMVADVLLEMGHPLAGPVRDAAGEC